MMSGASDLVEPSGITGHRYGEARTSYRHTPTVPWDEAKRYSRRKRGCSSTDTAHAPPSPHCGRPHIAKLESRVARKNK